MPGTVQKGDDARIISENATVRAKLDSALKEKDDRDARIKELEARVKESDEKLSSTEQSLAMERMEIAALKKKLEAADAKTRTLESDKGDLEDVMAKREESVRVKEEEIGKHEQALAAIEKRTSEDREKVKAQAKLLSEIEAKLEAREKVLVEKEATIAKDEAALNEVEASLKERDAQLVHGMEQLKGKQGEMDSMVDQYANRLAQVKLREDKVHELESRTKELTEKVERDRTEVGQLRVQVETDRADITQRSNGLYERIQKVEAKFKELDDREKVVKETERKAQRWQEDLRHTEIHLMSIQDEINSCVYCSAKDRFARVDRIIAEAKAIGADVEIAEEEVKGARVLMDQGQFDRAVEKATAAIRLAEKAKKQYYSYGVRYTIKAVEKIIASIKELGVSTEEPENMLGDAKQALAEEDYERAEDSAKMAERIALYTEEKAEEISANVRRIEGMVTKAKSEGRDTSAPEALMAEAKELARKGNYGSSLEYLRESERSLLEQQVTSVSEGLSKEPVVEETSPPPGPPAEPEPLPQTQEPAPEPQPQPQEVVQQPYYAAEPKPQPQPQPEPQVKTERFRCPYCQNIFEVRAAFRPVTTTCPYCNHNVMIS